MKYIAKTALALLATSMIAGFVNAGSVVNESVVNKWPDASGGNAHCEITRSLSAGSVVVTVLVTNGDASAWYQVRKNGALVDSNSISGNNSQGGGFYVSSAGSYKSVTDATASPGGQNYASSKVTFQW